jgi:murein DD-endopeptidase MepM/ murein hydrolase activator NlpD
MGYVHQSGDISPTSKSDLSDLNVLQQPTNLNLMDWPLSADFKSIASYPDSQWTWTYLDFNPGKKCPDGEAKSNLYSKASEAVWRDPTGKMDYNEDKRRVDPANRNFVNCYKGHEGTDIPAPYRTPVYAVADGKVIDWSSKTGNSKNNQRVTVEHWRFVDGKKYTWQVRYTHLSEDFRKDKKEFNEWISPTERTIIGYVGDFETPAIKNNSRTGDDHLHYEVERFSGDGLGSGYDGKCGGSCIVNPWGPIRMWNECPTSSANDFIFYKNPLGGQPDQCGGLGEDGYLKKNKPAIGTDARYDGLTMPLGSIAFPTACKEALYPFDSNKQYKIKALINPLYLDVNHASNEDNAAIIQWHWHGDSNQRWKFILIPGTADQYQIKAMNSDNQCLSVSSDSKAIQFSCDLTNPNQQWKVVKNTTGKGFFLKNMGHLPKVLDVPAFTNNPGDQIMLYMGNGGDNQVWEISEISEYALKIENAATKKVATIFWDDNDLNDNLQDVLKPGEPYNLIIQHIYEV